jgi:hypothetical protein
MFIHNILWNLSKNYTKCSKSRLSCQEYPFSKSSLRAAVRFTNSPLLRALHLPCSRVRRSATHAGRQVNVRKFVASRVYEREPPLGSARVHYRQRVPDRFARQTNRSQWNTRISTISRGSHQVMIKRCRATQSTIDRDSCDFLAKTQEVPMLQTHDMEKTKAWYESVLGFIPSPENDDGCLAHVDCWVCAGDAYVDCW